MSKNTILLIRIKKEIEAELEGMFQETVQSYISAIERFCGWLAEQARIDE